MRPQLFIRLPGSEPGAESAPASWLRPASALGPEVNDCGPLEQVAELATGFEIIVLAPATDILLASASVPTRNRQRMLQAVPYALEDQLISDIGELHFALGRTDTLGAVAVAVVACARIDAWLEALQGAGLQPDIVVPENLCLPWEPTSWTLLVEQDQVMLRTAVQRGMVADAENLDTIMQCALAEAGELRPQRLRLYPCTGPAIDPRQVAAEHGVVVETVPCPSDALSLLATHYDSEQAINLLQGRYSRKEQLSRLWRPWRATAALLAGLLILKFGSSIGHYAVLAGEDRALQMQIETLYRKTFPDAKKVVDARAQMQHRLEELQGNGASTGFLELVGAAGPVLREVPSIEVQNLRGQDGEIEFELNLRDLQALDQLKQRLTDDAKLDVEIVSATARDGKVEGRVKIRSKAS